MKRFIFMIIFIIAVGLASCSSEEPGETSVSDVDSLVETRVAATVDATTGDEQPTVAVEPTFPKVAGNATPLTPIPQYEETYIEVSPEVEYAPEEGDSPVTFDFGGGSTAEPQPTATLQPTSEATPIRTSAIGGTILTGTGTGETPIAYTLSSAELANSMTDGYGNVTKAQEGYRLLLVQMQAWNPGPQPFSTSTLRNVINYMPTYAVDLDDDTFPCIEVNEPVDNSGLIPPGYGIAFRIFCQIPVTAKTEGLNGLKLVNGGYNYPVNNFEFELGKRENAAADLGRLFEDMISHNLPVSTEDLCQEEMEAPYVIESASWYDRPAVNPDETTSEFVAEHYDSYGFPWPSQSESPEQAVAGFTEYWNKIWSAYDFDTLDLVAIRISRTNPTKSDLNQLWSQGSFALIDSDPFTPAHQIGSVTNADRLVNPFTFLDGTLPPGSTRQSVLYVLVPEAEEKVMLLHQVNCVTNHSTLWYMLEIPRAAFAQAENSQLSDVSATGSNSEESFSVGSTVARTVTGLALKKQQQVQATYISGRWRPGLTVDWQPVGTEGDDRVPAKASFPLPDAPLMALIFGIEGSDEVYLFEGPEMSFAAPESGVLWFGPNDDDLSDNSGELLITLAVK